MRSFGWLVAVSFLLAAGSVQAASQPSAVPCDPADVEDPVDADDAATGVLTARLNNTGYDVEGWICVEDRQGTLLGVWEGPFPMGHSSAYQWTLPLQEYNVTFYQKSELVWASGTAFVPLSDCQDRDGTAAFSIRYVPGVSVAFTAGGSCTHGPAENVTSASDPGGAPDGTDGGVTSASEGGDVDGAVSGSADAVATTTVAVAGSVGLIALLRFWPSLSFFAASLLGRRLVASAEEHPIRERVLDMVRSEPGIHANAVRRRLELGSGQVMHHLGILVNHRLVESVGRGGFRRFFPARRYGTQEKRAIASLRRRHAMAVYEALVRQPGIPLKNVARDVEVSASTVTKVVKNLGRADLVEGDPRRRTLKARGLSPAVRTALAGSDD